MKHEIKNKNLFHSIFLNHKQQQQAAAQAKDIEQVLWKLSTWPT